MIDRSEDVKFRKTWYRHGMNARKKDKPRDANKWPKWSLAWRSWDAGWEDQDKNEKENS